MLGKKIKQLRKEKEVTQQELAKYLNISAQAVCLWEKDKTDPDLINIKLLAKFFNVPTDYFFDLTDELGNPIKEQDLAPAMAPTVPKTTKVTMAAKSRGNKVKNLTIELTEEQLAELLKKIEEQQ